LQKKQHWPSSRVQLMDYYSRECFEAKQAALAPGEFRFPDVGNCIDAWGRIAFKITCENRGPNIAIAALLDIGLPGERLLEFIRVGTRCGLLDEARDAADHLIRFEHHRFQEFFCASHIRKELPALNWLPLMDAPRWQETIFNLVILGGGAAAVQALADAIRGPNSENTDANSISEENSPTNVSEKVSAAKDGDPAAEDAQGEKGTLDGDTARDGGDLDKVAVKPKEKMGQLEVLLHFLVQRLPEKQVKLTESALADRVELASRVLRHTGGASDATRQTLNDPLKATVKILVTHGNPLTQVKMLRACQNVPGIDYLEVLEAPLQSKNGWVRSQALVMLGAMRGAGHTTKNLVTEIAMDFATYRLLSSMKSYVKAIVATPSVATAMFLIFVSILQGVLLAAWAILGALAFDFTWTWLRRLEALTDPLRMVGTPPHRVDILQSWVSLLHWGAPTRHERTAHEAIRIFGASWFGPEHLPFWGVASVIFAAAFFLSSTISEFTWGAIGLCAFSGPCLWLLGLHLWEGDLRTAFELLILLLPLV